jgi:tRNA A37 methylthiotransferase MiaB
VSALVDALVTERAEDRIGEWVDVLVESVDGGGVEGRAAHQGPEVDGTTTVRGAAGRVGDLLRARVTATDGADLVADDA